MEGSKFDEAEFFRSIAASGARALLIGRRALVTLGIPVVTADYGFWLPPEDAERFNAAAARFDLRPTRSPAEARGHGRYTESDERVDVLLAGSVPAIDGVVVPFDDVWSRRVTLEAAPDVAVSVPCIDDLILTKRFGGRPKDAEDIRLLEALRRSRGEGPS